MIVLSTLNDLFHEFRVDFRLTSICCCGDIMVFHLHLICSDKMQFTITGSTRKLLDKESTGIVHRFVKKHLKHFNVVSVQC